MFDIWIGLMGLVAVLISNQTAIWFKFDDKKIDSGLYGFNALLAGLGTAILFAPGIELFVIVAITSILTLFITLIVEGFLSKYYLPFLSIPFLLSIWIIDLSQSTFIGIGVNERGIYQYNEIYAIGGKFLIDVHLYIKNLEMPFFLRDYFLSLSAIAFQYNIIAGVIISIALFFSSRISFILSLVGFYIAIIFYQFIGIDYEQYSYTYIGFNYILTSIALGGIYLIPSKWSYSWMLILLPIAVVLTFGFSNLFYVFGVPIYSLPFSIIVIMFLYVLKLRPNKKDTLVEPMVQYNSPEINIYQHLNNKDRFPIPFYLPTQLPVLGNWFVSQGANGKYTHVGEWGDAWDFIINDKKGVQYKNNGDLVEEYLCYNKPVAACADGTIVELLDGINDNVIGEVNTFQNWGNSLVIKHSEYLYSKISHLKKDSIKVKKGDFVKSGEIIASVGNSGRSPFPHLHFQFQLSPYIGAKTFRYPFQSVLKINEAQNIINYYIPKENETVANVTTNELVMKIFNFVPGQIIYIKETEAGFKQVGENDSFDLQFEVAVDAYNQSYIKCCKSNALAYFINTKGLFRFTDYIGNKKALLYKLFLSLYKIELTYYSNLIIEDNIPLDTIVPMRQRIFQDMISPFYIYKKSKYILKYLSIDNEFSPSQIELSSCVTVNTKIISEFKIYLSEKGFEINETLLNLHYAQIK